MAGTWWIWATAPQPTTARRTLEVFGFVMGRLWGNGYAGTAAYVTRAGAPHSPTPLSHPPPTPARERGASNPRPDKLSELTFSLFSPDGWVEGWEKRAGVMRGQPAGSANPQASGSTVRSRIAAASSAGVPTSR